MYRHVHLVINSDPYWTCHTRRSLSDTPMASLWILFYQVAAAVNTTVTTIIIYDNCFHVLDAYLGKVTLCSQCLYITSNPLVSLNNMYDSNHIILKTGAQRDQRTLVRSSTSWNQDSNQPHLALTVQLDLSPHQSRHTVNGQSLCEVQAAQNPLKTSSWASGKALHRSASMGLTKATHLLMMLPMDRRQRTQIRISRKSLIYNSSQKVYHDEFLIWQPGLLMTINHLISF